MAEAEAPAQPPAPPAEGTEAVPKEKFTAKRACRHCGETKPVAHEQWCKKNPNRRTKVVLPKPGEKAADKPAGPKKRDYKAEHERRKAKAAAKPAEAPAKPAVKSQEAFLEERKAELKGTAPKPGEKPADETPAPDSTPKPKTSTKTWLVLGLAGAGALLFLWALASDPPQGEQPRNRGQRAAPDAELKPNGIIPGVGPVHVPGLG